MTATTEIEFDRKNASHVKIMRRFCEAYLSQTDEQRPPVGSGVVFKHMCNGKAQRLPVDKIFLPSRFLVYELRLPIELREGVDCLFGNGQPEEEIVEIQAVQSEVAGEVGNITT